MRFIQLVIFAILFPCLLLADGKYEITFFETKNVSKDYYSINLKAKGSDVKELCGLLKGDNDKKSLSFLIGDSASNIDSLSNTKSTIYAGTIDFDGKDEFYFDINADNKIDGKKYVKLVELDNATGETRLIDSFEHIFAVNSDSTKLPIIYEVKPSGGKAGDTIILYGNNFGNNIDKLNISFSDLARDRENRKSIPQKDKKKEVICTITKDDFIPEEIYEIITDTVKPVYLNTIINKAKAKELGIPIDTFQELHFTLPSSFSERASNSFLRRDLKLKVFLEGRPSIALDFSLLPDNWNLKISIISITLTILGWLVIFALIRRVNPKLLSALLVDVDTNTYNLARMQALAWTFVLAASYFYIALCYGVLLQNGLIPDFNASLIGLMAISYTGMISANFLDTKVSKNGTVDTAPHLSDLFMNNGVIDISKLQLLVFNVIAIVIYIYNLALSNSLNGLPDIPVTLHSLLVTSQAGFLSAKAIGDKIVVNRINPRTATVGTEVEFDFIGNGFVEGTKLMFDGESGEPSKATIQSQTLMKCKLATPQTAGKKNLLIIPPSGNMITIPDAVEMIAPVA